MTAWILLLCAGCAHPGPTAGERVAPAPSIGSLETAGAETTVPHPTAGDPETSRPIPASGDRQVVYTGWIGVQVGDLGAAERRVLEIAKERGGWIHRMEGSTITLRIPAAGFHETMGAISGLGRLLDRRLEAQDVTEEFQDLELRLAAARKVHARLTALLEQGGTMKDILEIEREMARVADQIERMEGRLRALKDRIAYATLTVRLQGQGPAEKPTPARIPMPFPWVRRLGVEELLRF